MPCTACGKGGLNVGSKRPSAMVLGRNRGVTVRKNVVQKPRGLILTVSKNKTFLLGRR